MPVSTFPFTCHDSYSTETSAFNSSPIVTKKTNRGTLDGTEDADNPDHCGYTHCYSFQDYVPDFDL